MDARGYGRIARSLETLHALSYFSPEVDNALVEAGLRRGRTAYFASRAAPMGPVSPGVVTATFYNFSSTLVTKLMTGVWDTCTPEAATAARYAGVDAAYRRLLGADALASREVAQAAELARAATAGCRLEGRPLYAGHASLAWPEEPHMVLFHALTLLREHRGDGHVATLVQAGLTGLEALVTHVVTGRGFTVAAAQAGRGWSPEHWAEACEALADRGLLDPGSASAEPVLTAAGEQLRADLENATDEADLRPWATLGPAGAQRLAELGKPLVRQALEAGAFPPGVFARG